MEKYVQINSELFEFIKNSPTPYHAVESAVKMLEQNGFKYLDECEAWALNNGGKYYTVCNNSSLLAFTVPKKEYSGFHIVASHSDTPGFKLKENCEILEKDKYTTLNVEMYGGAICSTWFDRPLSIAGRVVIQKDGKLVSELLNFDEDLVSIINLAIHLERDANNGKKYKLQKDMLPIFAGIDNDNKLKCMIAKKLNINEDELIDYDLFLYNRMYGTTWGANKEFVSAPRIDDLQCCFASIKALLNSTHEDKICIAAIFDNEEVGSLTKQGAQSTFLKHALTRISNAFCKTKEQHIISLAKSCMVSADNGHAMHPNYADKSDITNRPCVGGGVLIKYSANQKYTTDAFSGGAMRTICKNAGIPYQTYYNNSDMPGGSTLGNISASQVSIACADIGVAMLAMHSAYETAGAKDTFWLVKFMSEFFNTNLI